MRKIAKTKLKDLEQEFNKQAGNLLCYVIFVIGQILCEMTSDFIFRVGVREDNIERISEDSI
jgi:hypothetical protein